MHLPVSEPRTPAPWWQRLVLGGALLTAVFWYANFLCQFIAPHAGGSDSSGYLNNARILSEGKLYTEPRLLAEQPHPHYGEFANIPLGFVPRQDGHMVPTYPTGYPLQLIAFSAFGWEWAPVILNVITALGSGVLLFLYCRKIGVRPCLSVGGVVLLLLCPLFLFSAFQPMSDLSAVFWALAVLYWALLARENWKYSLLTGAALSMAVLVRPTNALLAVPLCVALGFRPRLWLGTIAAALPGAAFFCYYNWRVYGSPLQTGYGGMSNVLGPGFVQHNLAHFAFWIPSLLSPLVVLVLAVPFTDFGLQKGMAVLATWAAVLIGFYTFYFHSGEHWWYLRFILPAFPFFLVGALAVLETIWRKGNPRPLIAGLAFVTVLIFGVIWEQRKTRSLDVLHLKRDESSYLAAALWARNNLPANSVIFCMQVSGAFFYYTDFILFRWEQIDPDKYDAALNSISREKRPVYAVLFPFETSDAQKRIGGHWTKLSTVGQASIWQREP